MIVNDEKHTTLNAEIRSVYFNLFDFEKCSYYLVYGRVADILIEVYELETDISLFIR